MLPQRAGGGLAKREYGVYQEIEGVSASRASPTSLATCLSPPEYQCPVLRCRMLGPLLCPGPSLSAGLQGLSSPRSTLCGDGWATLLPGTRQPLCLWQAGPFSLSLYPYQCSAAGPGARPHSLNYRLHGTQCSLLKAYTGRRERRFHGKESELNPLLLLSETPCQADTVC